MVGLFFHASLHHSKYPPPTHRQTHLVHCKLFFQAIICSCTFNVFTSQSVIMILFNHCQSELLSLHHFTSQLPRTMRELGTDATMVTMWYNYSLMKLQLNEGSQWNTLSGMFKYPSANWYGWCCFAQKRHATSCCYKLVWAVWHCEVRSPHKRSCLKTYVW